MNSDISCASSIVVKENNPESFVFPYPILNKKLLPVIFSYPRKVSRVRQLIDRTENDIYPFAHLFNGALISINAIKSIGNVNTEYFMFGDELDYLFRLRKVGKVVSVCKALHFHPDVTSRPYNQLKIYYFIKNTLILNKKYYNFKLIRNFLTVLIILYRTLRRNGFIYLFQLMVGKYNRIFYSAIVRGLNGKIGKDHFE
tara:strand:- start:116 stop:712 length:597 start_codon:yes stop_codon:yes gene_type:complete